MFRSAHTQPSNCSLEWSSNCSLSDTNLVAVAFQLSFGVAFQLHLPTVAVGQPLLSQSLFVTGVSPSAVGVTLSLKFFHMIGSGQRVDWDTNLALQIVAWGTSFRSLWGFEHF